MGKSVPSSKPSPTPTTNPVPKHLTAKVKFIQKKLNQFYPEPPIPLDHTSEFTLLVAVLLSAQCTDKTVNLVTPNLFKLADNPFDMANLSAEKIKSVIKRCGLSPKKSVAIKTLSEKLIKEQNGVVPPDINYLETLPGVGHKTASVVMSQAFGIPAFAVDTHIHRLATRWQLTSGKNVVQTEVDLKSLFPKKDWNKLHLQIIYYGREYCPARNHQIENCPICLKFGVTND